MNERQKIYDEMFGWIKNGTSEPTLYISTEQEKEEVQTMMLAFLSNVSEDHILNGKYEGDEEDRVREAARILSESPLYIEELPDFSLQDIENTIKIPPIVGVPAFFKCASGTFSLIGCPCF